MRAHFLLLLAVDACFSKWFGKKDEKKNDNTVSTVELTTTVRPIIKRPGRVSSNNQRGRSQTVNNDTQVRLRKIKLKLADINSRSNLKKSSRKVRGEHANQIQDHPSSTSVKKLWNRAKYVGTRITSVRAVPRRVNILRWRCVVLSHRSRTIRVFATHCSRNAPVCQSEMIGRELVVTMSAGKSKTLKAQYFNAIKPEYVRNKLQKLISDQHFLWIQSFITDRYWFNLFICTVGQF